MRITSLLLILLLAFQCLPHSVRIRTVAVCMQKENVQPEDIPMQNPTTLVEDEIPHFILSLSDGSETANDRLPHYPVEISHWADAGCKIPGNQAHDIETPPPNCA